MDAACTVLLLDQIEREVQAELQEQNQMSRLREKLASAAGVVKRVSTEIEAEADKLLEREQALRTQTGVAFAAHKDILSDAQAGLDELENELRQFSNAPLESSERPAVWSPNSARSVEK